MDPKAYIVAASPFEAALQVDILPPNHRSRRLHGHSFVARVRAGVPTGQAAFAGDEPDFLERQLQACTRQLDYRNLNDYLAVPTDENLARWIRAHLVEVPAIEKVGVQSTRDMGADIDQDDHAHIWRRYRFEAAHQLPNVPQGHQCGRMHGHGFEVILHANQTLGDRDMGVDYDHLDECWAPIHAQLHNRCLNDIQGLENPTSEIIASWIWDRLKGVIPELSWVTVYETVTAGCHYDGEHYRIWKEMRFESAVRLRRATEGDPRRRLHGHSYVARLHLLAPLDEVMGWTVDYGDVKDIFKPTYDRIDHHRLDELPGIDDADTLSLLNWIKRRIIADLPQLNRIDLYATPGCGAILTWGANGPALPA